MGHRKHLRRLRVSAVYENEWRKVIGQCEATELLRIELAPVVAADLAADHYEHAEGVRLLDELPQRVCPGWHLTAFSRSKASARRIVAAIWTTSCVTAAVPAKGSGVSPMVRAKSRYHSWRC